MGRDRTVKLGTLKKGDKFRFKNEVHICKVQLTAKSDVVWFTRDDQSGVVITGDKASNVYKIKEPVKKQPIPKQGSDFKGWAVYNWGYCLNKVFRTRKEAKEWCVNRRKGETWEDIKGHYHIAKVVCIVI